MGGWLKNQDGRPPSANLIVVIPGKDRSRAVIMADHYDTAYMADRYEPSTAATAPRLAACGAGRQPLGDGGDDAGGADLPRHEPEGASSAATSG